VVRASSECSQPFNDVRMLQIPNIYKGFSFVIGLSLELGEIGISHADLFDGDMPQVSAKLILVSK